MTHHIFKRLCKPPPPPPPSSQPAPTNPPSVYEQFLTHKHGQPMINAELIKALCGTLQAALLFWQNLTSVLENEHGFEVYPYDWCAVNKTINGKQCTVSWHVDDLKISHMDQLIVKTIITTLQDCYRQETPLVVHCGQVHDYLGMAIDYSIPGKVCFSMDQYITNLLVECPDHLMNHTHHQSLI